MVLPSNNQVAQVPFFRAHFSHTPAWPDLTRESSLWIFLQSHLGRHVLGTSPGPHPLFLSDFELLGHLKEGILLF